MAFNPNDHLSAARKGGPPDYLQVKWRIAWFRDEWPNGVITSEHIEISENHAVFRATAIKLDADGKELGSATDYGSETKQDFKDYIEKASTKAIGRALAALGYGTQFAPELDEGERIVDSPVQRPQQPRSAPKQGNATPDTPAPKDPDRERVMKALHAAGKDAGMEHIDLHNLIVAKGHESMKTAPVEALIDLGKAIKSEPAKLKQWLAKQAELLPSEADLPTPKRSADSYAQ